MNASFMTCQDIQMALFSYLDSDDETFLNEKTSLDEQVMKHLQRCSACQNYQRELSFLIQGVKSSTLKTEPSVMPNMDKLVDRVWEKLLEETDLGSLPDISDSNSVRFLKKSSRSKAWWAQPVAPMAAAAALVVMAGFSYTQFGNFSDILSFQTAYVSPDYELDGQKLVYDSADQILDPTWIEDSDSNDQLPFTSFQGANQAILGENQAASSGVLLDSNNDPLAAWVGF